MATKPDGKLCTIREQIVEDASGLIFQFEVTKGFQNGVLVDETVMHVYGDALPCGNRSITFGPDGAKTASGTSVRGLCRPGWLTQVGDD